MISGARFLGNIDPSDGAACHGMLVQQLMFLSRDGGGIFRRFWTIQVLSLEACKAASCFTLYIRH